MAQPDPLPNQPAADAASALDSLVAIGLNHRTAPLAMRERLAGALPALAPRFAALGVVECVPLATCDRVELIALEATAGAGAACFRTLDADARPYCHRGPDALRHLFRVAASLDSQVIGEPHVLGQLKSAHRAAAEAGLSGPLLDGLLAAAYAAAKRVRSETAIGGRPVTLAAAAIELVRELHGPLDTLAALLIGAGDTTEFLAGQLAAAGLARFTVATRLPRQAEALAGQLGAHAIALDDLAGALAHADLVVAAVGSGRYLLDRQQVEQALRARRRRPIFLIDLGMPADIEAAAGALDGAFLYTLDDLERVAMAGREARAAALQPAEAIIEAELARQVLRQAERAVVPALVALRRRFETVRNEVLVESPDAATATRLLINRLLHGPSIELRRDPALADAARRLFGLVPGRETEE